MKTKGVEVSQRSDVDTPNRKIHTPIPHPDDVQLIEQMRLYEPRALGGQFPVVWDRAEGVQVFDRHGNQWLDFSSGIVVANAGHGGLTAIDGIRKTLEKPLHHSYCFANAERAGLVEYLVTACAPREHDKVLLLTTGSEAVECALKIARHYGHLKYGPEKDMVVSLSDSFHGRTMGAQMAGGIPALKSWIHHPDPAMIRFPSPQDGQSGEQAFADLARLIQARSIEPTQLAAIILETYPGWTAQLLPKSYVQLLRRFCDQHSILLIMDEVQAGFGRCGRFWGFRHYEITPDLIVCGKGISSGLPLAAVIGQSAWMDCFEEATLTSTHGGNPICCSAALANLREIIDRDLSGNAARLEPLIKHWLSDLKQQYPLHIGHTGCTGLVAVFALQQAGTGDADSAMAKKVVAGAIKRGVMLLAAGGQGASTVKICPPLTISRKQLDEGLSVIRDLVDDLMGQPLKNQSV